MSKTVYARNKKAEYEYFIEDRYEAGLSLKGNEAASIKRGGCSISGAFVRIENGEAFAYGINVPKHESSGVFAAEPLRIKKLLLHKSQIEKLSRQVEEKRKAIVVLSVYELNGLLKAEIALCQGKKLYDKRECVAKRDAERKISSVLKQNAKI